MASCAPVLGGQEPFSVAPGHLNSEIVGGRAVADGSQFSRQVALVTVSKTTKVSETLSEKRIASCSGTFIARDIVLTAAHCLAAIEFDEITVQFGVNEKAVSFSTKVNQYAINTKFSMATGLPDDDLALLRTTTLLPETHTVTLLATQSPAPLSAAAAVGYGINYYTENRGPTATDSRVLRTAHLHIDQILLGNPKTFSVVVDDANGVSHGDSGGPLFILEDEKVKQIGVASSITSESVGARANYVDVLGQAEWIRQTIETLKK